MPKYAVENVPFGGVPGVETSWERCVRFDVYKNGSGNFPTVYDLVEAAVKEFPNVSLNNLRVLVTENPGRTIFYLRAVSQTMAENRSGGGEK